MPTKKPANLYTDLELHDYAYSSPQSYRAVLLKAVPLVHQLTGETPPVTQSDRVKETLEAMGSPALHLAAFKQALASFDPVAAHEHYARAEEAKALANRASHSQEAAELIQSLEAEHFRALTEYISENLAAARTVFNDAASKFSEAWNNELAQVQEFSEDTLTLTPERLSAYEVAAEQVGTIEQGAALKALLPQLFKLPRFGHAHALTYGNALAASRDENPPRPNVLNGVGAAHVNDQANYETSVNYYLLTKIVEFGYLLNALARPKHDVRLYWKTPQEHESEHKTFEQMQQELGNRFSYREAINWWKKNEN